MLGCQILCVLRACIIFTEKTLYTQKTVLAVAFWTEAAMSSVTAECKEAGMLCSVPTFRLRNSNPHHLAGESFCAQRRSHPSLCLKKKEPNINQAQESTGADTQGSAVGLKTFVSANLGRGDLQGSAVSSSSGSSVELR